MKRCGWYRYVPWNVKGLAIWTEGDIDFPEVGDSRVLTGFRRELDLLPFEYIDMDSSKDFAGLTCPGDIQRAALGGRRRPDGYTKRECGGKV